MNRPIGVAIVGILALLRGLIALLGGLRLSGASTYMLFGGFYGASASYGVWGYIAVLLGIGIMVIAYGLWNMQPWAWKWAIGLLIAGLAVDVIAPYSAGTGPARPHLPIDGE